MKHGEIVVDGDYNGCRWCEVHKHFHGPLYRCPEYSESILKEIDDQKAKLKENLKDDHSVAATIMKALIE